MNFAILVTSSTTPKENVILSTLSARPATSLTEPACHVIQVIVLEEGTVKWPSKIPTARDSTRTITTVSTVQIDSTSQTMESACLSTHFAEQQTNATEHVSLATPVTSSNVDCAY